ncbi:hypothetical protein BCR36DRAFT_453322, partial [Piromyces finnis]
SECIYFTEVWSELQKISKSDTTYSVISSTFSELDVQHNYVIQLISSQRQPTKKEFQSLLRIILFPSRRLIRFLEENHSVTSLDSKRKTQVAIPSDLEQLILELSNETFKTTTTNNNVINNDKDTTLIFGHHHDFNIPIIMNTFSQESVVNEATINVDSTYLYKVKGEEDEDVEKERKINKNTYDFSSLSFEDRIILNGICVMLQHFYQIFKIFFPKFDFDYRYTKFTTLRNKKSKRNE